MSYTPRTDDNTWTTICGNLKGVQSETETDLYVPVNVSRQLECELNAANERIKKLIGIGNMFVNCEYIEGYEHAQDAWIKEVKNDRIETS